MSATIRRVPVESSDLRSVGYDAGSQTLEVEFHKGLRVYQYLGVPAHLHVGLMAATASHGKYFNAHIKDQFRYLRVD